MKETTKMLEKIEEGNLNQKLIEGLQMVITFLKAHPDLPDLGEQDIGMWLYSKEDLRAIAKELGSFKKESDNHFFRLIAPVNERVDFRFTISRETVCKKVVTWDCPEDLVSLLKEDEEELITVGE